MKNEQNSTTQEQPTLGQLWDDIKKHRKLYCKVLGITFIASVIITLSIPNYYKCTVMLAPEMPGGNKGTSGLASLANSFGVNLNSASGADALMPNLYPDLMNSVAFRASLFPVKVQQEDGDTAMTYYDYLENHQRLPWWSAAMKTFGDGISSVISSLFGAEEKTSNRSDKVNPFRLTKEETAIVGAMKEKVVCDVDKKTFVITIDVTDQDPLIAATMADSVQTRLQDFITDYRTRKARIDMDYTQKLYAEAKQKYENARKKHAAYADANQRAFLQRVRSEQSELQTELQIAQTAYTQLSARLQMAEAKVQEETPAFTTLQPATVPVRKAGPKRSVICLALLILAFIVTTLFVWNKESHLKPLLSPSESTPDFDELSFEDLAFLLTRARSSKSGENQQKSDDQL